LTRNWPLIRESLVEDGNKIICWRDPWIPNVGPLDNLIPGHSTLDMNCLLSDMVIGPQRVKFFIWLVFKHRLLTMKEIVRRGLGHDLTCGVCSHVSEDVLHVLRDCTATRYMWDLLIQMDWHTKFYSSSLQEWLVLNLWFYYSGGIARNREEEWILGFKRYLGNCSVFYVEFWGILDGLTLLLDREYGSVLIQTNNLEVAKAI
ncbi:hypothetical protein Goari_010233, partial [Gossypium aridum]|nr:hypothetical protein [Gossypium aridum]